MVSPGFVTSCSRLDAVSLAASVAPFWNCSSRSMCSSAARARISFTRVASMPGPDAVNVPNGETMVNSAMKPSVGTVSAMV